MAEPLVSENCVTCLHARTLSTDPRCIDCLKHPTAESQFPGWEPVQPQVAQ